MVHFNFKTKMYATMINLRRKTYKSNVLCWQRAPSSDRFENLPRLKHNTKPTPPELCWRYRRGLVASIVCVTYITSRQCVHCARWHPECVFYPKLKSSSPAGVRISWRLVHCTTNIPACILYVLHLNPQPAPSQLPRSRQNIPLVLLLSSAHKFNCLESLTDGAEYLCSWKIIWVCC